jgi:excinuclease ABC subunit C
MEETYRTLEGVSGMPEAEVLGEFLEQYYGRAASIPKQVLLPHAVEEQAVLEQWLSERRGAKVEILVPRRGDRRELVELVAANAAQRLNEVLDQVGAEEKRGQEAVTELQRALRLANRPNRIEAFDISTLRGGESVGSMVVFEAGRPKKADYRRFRIRLATGDSDDVAMLREMLERRLRAAAASGKFAQLPDLLLLDGGKPQLSAALQAMEQIGVALPAAGLAKEHEFVYLPGRAEPAILPANSKALHLLQRVRDEAHRFAQAYHHALRARRTRESVLDDVPGIGAARKRRLLAHFGSVAKLRAASADEIARVPGVTSQVAAALAEHLHEETGI